MRTFAKPFILLGVRHRLRQFAVSSLAVGIGALASFGPSALSAPSGARSVTNLPQLDSDVLKQLNLIRQQHRLVALRGDPALDASAAEHSQQMGLDGYFHHSSADGTSFWRRIADRYPARGFARWAVGENLLWQSSEVDARQIVRMWMASPPHRANILDPAWRQVGVAATHFATAPGIFQGRAVTIVTVDFGVRS